MLTTEAFKLLGLCLLSGGITFFGISKSESLNACIKTRKAVEELLYAVESGIKYGGQGKQSIYNGFESNVLQGCGFLAAIKSGECETKCVKEYLKELDKDDSEALCSYFTLLGKSYSSKQEAEKCKAFAEEFARKGVLKEKNLISKSQLYKKLGLICAIMSVIIFI